MAESPSHKFGQIIGKLLEDLLHPVLEEFCHQRGLYLDVQGARRGVRNGKKVTWSDKYNNNHDLDFVIEKGGTQYQRGRPVAFIEAAWRRYTKHSRNKAQEIQGSILPISDKYEWDKPFLGSILAGEFTSGSLNQLRSVGFHILYFPYESIISAFSSVGIDASFNEKTPDIEFKKCIEKINSLSPEGYNQLKSYLVSEQQNLFHSFLMELTYSLDRVIDKLIIIPLFGKNYTFECISEAAQFLYEYNEEKKDDQFMKYEIIVKYSNGDNVEASFHKKCEVSKFLRYLGS